MTESLHQLTGARDRAPAARGIAAHPAGAVEIRAAVGVELTAGATLLAGSLGFEPRDAIPAWLMQTTVDHGGLALGAFGDGQLAGFSYALQCGDWELFSCGLAVAPAWRGHGVGRRLKCAQRDRALRDGRSRIRWTADPLSAPALTLYLAGLGAHLVGYEEELYAAVRPSPVPPDDVLIDWRLDGAPPARMQPGPRVEIPLDGAALGVADRLAWRMRVRRSMQRALASGAIGTGMAVDRVARRCWVLFEQPVA